MESRILKSSEAPMDVISALPENVKSLIMERLSLQDAGRMAVLSSKWKSTWLSLSKLTFDSKFCINVLKKKRNDPTEVYKIVSAILLRHVGPINEIKFYVPRMNSGAKMFLDPWISFLSRNNVKTFILYNAYSDPLKVNSHVFSFLELEKLKLTNCLIDLPPSYNGFRNLTCLHLERINLTANSLKSLVDKCPELESLTLNLWSRLECIDITAPKLKYLEVSGKFDSVCFHDSPKLISISISLEIVGSFSSITARKQIEFLSNLRELQKLNFSGNFFKFLAKGKIWGMFLPEYKCLKVLELSNIKANAVDEFCCLIGMIQSCPNVEDMMISFSSTRSSDHNIDKHAYNTLLHRLRKVVVNSVKGFSTELNLIGFLLKCSPQLEKLYVRRDLSISAKLESQMMRQLMRFPRTSSKAEIIYVELEPVPKDDSGDHLTLKISSSDSSSDSDSSNNSSGSAASDNSSGSDSSDASSDSDSSDDSSGSSSDDNSSESND